jgi:hypothetical protein
MLEVGLAVFNFVVGDRHDLMFKGKLWLFALLPFDEVGHLFVGGEEYIP